MKDAFTLAEVLITLGVIGIVAAITISPLIANHKEKVLVTRVKKAYSEFQNSLELYAAQNNCNDISYISDTNQTSEELTKKLFKQFNGAKYCRDANIFWKSKCTSSSMKHNTQYYRDGVTSEIGTFTPSFISANGVAYMVVQYSSCPDVFINYKRDENGNILLDKDGNPVTYTYISNVCARFYFDANGTNN